MGLSGQNTLVEGGGRGGGGESRAGSRVVSVWGVVRGRGARGLCI